MGEKEKSVHITSRIREDLSLMIPFIIRETGLDKRKILELSLIDFILKIESKIEYEGIDLKENAKLIKLHILRDITKIERNEFLSGQLVIPRIRGDIYKLIIYHRKNKNLKKLIMDYFSIRKKECIHYKTKDEILGYIADYEKLLEKSEMDRILRKIEDEADILDISKNTKQISYKK